MANLSIYTRLKIGFIYTVITFVTTCVSIYQTVKRRTDPTAYARWMTCPRCLLSANCCKFSFTLLEYMMFFLIAWLITCNTTGDCVCKKYNKDMKLDDGRGQLVETFSGILFWIVRRGQND